MSLSPIEALKKILEIADDFYKHHSGKASKQENEIYKIASEALSSYKAGEDLDELWVEVFAEADIPIDEEDADLIIRLKRKFNLSKK